MKATTLSMTGTALALTNVQLNQAGAYFVRLASSGAA